ncbi:hypothetical protein [Nonomuraea recticatena]|uniref:MFS transporter n=1 Tax=Nonomuraea recticatena TaxID=46178 RepID=A0ABN3THK7_9ACTN
MGNALLTYAREAFASGLNVAAVTTAAIVAAAAVLARARLRHVPATDQPTEGEHAPA